MASASAAVPSSERTGATTGAVVPVVAPTAGRSPAGRASCAAMVVFREGCTMHNMVRTSIRVVSVVMVMAMTAGTAFAGGDYNTPGAVAGEQTGGGGSLPFTGADLGMYLLAGVAVA